MSTLMSTDMHLSRASSRVNAPPGGKSSISFHSDNDTSITKENSNKNNHNNVPLSTFSFANQNTITNNNTSLGSYLNTTNNNSNNYTENVPNKTNQRTSLGNMLKTNGNNHSTYSKNSQSLGDYTHSHQQPKNYGHSSDSSIGNMLGGDHTITSKHSKPIAYNHNTQRNASESSIGNMLGGDHTITSKHSKPIAYNHNTQRNASESSIGNMLGGNSQNTLPVQNQLPHHHSNAYVANSSIFHAIEGENYHSKGNLQPNTPSKKLIQCESTIGDIMSGSVNKNYTDDSTSLKARCRKLSSGGGQSSIVLG
eukprot:TRINITY_DN61384_c0_g1_i1.p1 TRINITY_DN61384_c0_g1~~TRINITY_DN61384_c0_g1_i1.p1  ORF type:complete len:309 (+),score=-30.09 TRINITY_DN61384_c0_g1_i1:37-963(+)